jgi:hypothetical protein
MSVRRTKAAQNPNRARHAAEGGATPRSGVGKRSLPPGAVWVLCCCMWKNVKWRRKNALRFSAA